MWALRKRSQFEHGEHILLKYFGREKSPEELQTGRYVQSSAKRRKKNVYFGRSSMKIKEKRGTRKKTLGKPDVTGLKL